jgi:glutamine amidotransferase
MKNPRITIIDYGMGNLHSVRNAIKQIGFHSDVSDNPMSFVSSDALILPGVGAFGEAMINLKRLKMVEPLRDAVLNFQKPLLGICLGMQLLADRSEELGDHEGLALIPGSVGKIPAHSSLRLPHIGWNELSIHYADPLFKGIKEKSAFYFVHSYQFECDPKYISATTDYGKTVTAAIQSANIFGTQFHPERSQSKGLNILRNFIESFDLRSQEEV